MRTLFAMKCNKGEMCLYATGLVSQWSSDSALNGSFICPRFFSVAISCLSRAITFLRSDFDIVFHTSLNFGSKAARVGLRRSANDTQLEGRGCWDDDKLFDML